MFPSTALLADTRRLVAGIDPAAMTPGEAAAVLEELATVARISGAAATLLAKRASDATAWRKDGHREVGAWVGVQLGLTLTDGRRLVQASHRLAGSPETAARLLDGEISPLAAAAILEGKAAAEAAVRRRVEREAEEAKRREAAEEDARRREAQAAGAGESDAADEDDVDEPPMTPPLPEPKPGVEPEPVRPVGKSPEQVERELLDLAGDRTQMHELRRRAEREAAAARDQLEQRRHLHRVRSFRPRVREDGAVGGEFWAPPEVAAMINGRVDAETEAVFVQARREGRREGRAAYAFDAFCRIFGVRPSIDPDAPDADVRTGPATPQPAAAPPEAAASSPTPPGPVTEPAARDAAPDPGASGSTTRPAGADAATPPAGPDGSGSPRGADVPVPDGTAPPPPVHATSTPPAAGIVKGGGDAGELELGLPPTDPEPGPAVKPRVEVRVRVDAAALRRDDLVPGDVCEIVGVGPVSSAAARELLGEAVVFVVIHNGVDVQNVTYLGRELSRELLVGVSEQHPRCVDCGTEHGLENDHDLAVALGGDTSMANLKPRCRADHGDKTRSEASRTIRAGRRRIQQRAEDNARIRARLRALAASQAGT
jgi:hypothetical protein